jgi:hypothetical protein
MPAADEIIGLPAPAEVRQLLRKSLKAGAEERGDGRAEVEGGQLVGREELGAENGAIVCRQVPRAEQARVRLHRGAEHYVQHVLGIGDEVRRDGLDEGEEPSRCDVEVKLLAQLSAGAVGKRLPHCETAARQKPVSFVATGLLDEQETVSDDEKGSHADCGPIVS